MTRTSSVGFFGVALLSTTALMCNDPPKNRPDEGTVRGGAGGLTGAAGAPGTAENAGTAGIISIWEPPPFGWADREHPYQACEGAAVATGDTPTIADFNGNTLHVLANEGRNGAWYRDDDGSDGDLSVELNSGALHVISKEWSMWGAGIGVTIGPALSDTQRCYYDASRYAGIRFRAKGSGTFRFNVGTLANYPVSGGGQCNLAGENCLDWPGGTGKLTSEWKTYEFPFCALRAAGWGETSPLDPTQLVDLFILLGKGETKELWLDDLAFYTTETAESPVSCAVSTCPMDVVPAPASVRPDSSWLPLTDELTLHNFDQETAHCGPIRRRYLTFVPRALPPETNAPVFIALNGTASSAESMDSFLARGRLDALATRDGAIVVYANAAPGPYSTDNPKWLNCDTWRHPTRDDGEVDDVAYIDLVLEDLQKRGVIAGTNDVYLMGLSIGGGMVLQLAKAKPQRFKGIAPLMAYDGWSSAPVPPLSCSGISRIFFGISSEDPGLPENYREVLFRISSEWAAAAGLSRQVIDSPVVTELPNTVNEGADYTGNSPVALRTRNSHVIQRDMNAPGACARVRILEFVGGGHLWPTPQLGEKADLSYVELYGFTNQDLDLSDAIWDFFMAKE